MKKLKKIFASIGVFIIGIFLRVVPVLSLSFYGGAIDYDSVVAATNEKEISTFEKIMNALQPLLSILLPIILFIIGTVVLLNKKISKNVKILFIIIAVLLIVLNFIIL